ncbi:hypothetical protein [Pseudomonas cichorii]|uniref:hypothetical protein n=1 Tax=Pseudomonas cichorii TaxID=36746 RepID=UPI00115F8D53|nr:hypothetical protein [Pseudomonas cichorii]QVE18561.1 hypothetical protein KGD89_07450 [Pseudomonas cichorii]
MGVYPGLSFYVPLIKKTDSGYAYLWFFNVVDIDDPVGHAKHYGAVNMATAILGSIKQGAYIAISLYVVFIAVVTITSMNPQLKTRTYESAAPSVVVAADSQERAS